MRGIRNATIWAGLLAMSSVAACGGGGSTVDAHGARVAIDRAYGTLFNFADASVTAKTAVIEDGSTLAAAIREALGSSLAKSATGARVDKVQILGADACAASGVSSPCAKVTYDLLGPGGTPLFPTASSGYAVLSGGRWLVAKSTICGLLGLFFQASGRSGAPPGC